MDKILKETKITEGTFKIYHVSIFIQLLFVESINRIKFIFAENTFKNFENVFLSDTKYECIILQVKTIP